MDPGLITDFIRDNNLTRFQTLKIKVNQENALDLIREVSKNSSTSLIIDGNEAWEEPDSLLRVLEMAGKRKNNYQLQFHTPQLL